MKVNEKVIVAMCRFMEHYRDDDHAPIDKTEYIERCKRVVDHETDDYDQWLADWNELNRVYFDGR